LGILAPHQHNENGMISTRSIIYLTALFRAVQIDIVQAIGQEKALNQQLSILLNSNVQQFNLLCKRLLTLQAVVSINLNGLFGGKYHENNCMGIKQYGSNYSNDGATF
jgi:hypothetical protein